MSLSKFALVALATISMVAAGPIEKKETGPTYGDVQAQCGNNQSVSCCNTQKTGDNSANSGLLGTGDILDGLLGGSCSQLSIPG